MMERSIRRYNATSNFPISLENSIWLESMGSLVNKGEESRILLGRRSQFWFELPGGLRDLKFQN